jgi:hypothetical protein
MLLLLQALCVLYTTRNVCSAEPNRLAKKGPSPHNPHPNPNGNGNGDARFIQTPPGYTPIADVLHNEHVKIISSIEVDVSKWGAVDVTQEQCGWLDHKVWNAECNKNSKFYKNLEPITSFVAMVKNWSVDYNSRHKEVAGTIFKGKTYFCPQHYIRAHKEPIAGTHRAHKVDKLATVLQAYPAAYGHFPHETLPKLVYLLETCPPDTKFLLEVNAFTQQYLNLLGIDEKRVIKYNNRGQDVYTANEVYFSSTAPFISSNDPHRGGKTFLFPKELFDMMRKRIIPALPPPPKDLGSDYVLLIERTTRVARNLTNFGELLTAIIGKVGRSHVRVFTGREPVAEVIML